MTPNTSRPQPVTGRQLVGALAAIFVATAVLPPAAAWSLNTFRVGQTGERARVLVNRLATLESRSPVGPAVACGPGRLPGRPSASRGNEAHAAWLKEVTRAPELFEAGMPTDAWGRCFLINPHWVLSAGPNGLIETPLDATGLAGDDIGVRRE